MTIEETHQTKPYSASEFSPDAYVPPPRTIEGVTADHSLAKTSRHLSGARQRARKQHLAATAVPG